MYHKNYHDLIRLPIEQTVVLGHWVSLWTSGPSWSPAYWFDVWYWADDRSHRYTRWDSHGGPEYDRTCALNAAEREIRQWRDERQEAA